MNTRLLPIPQILAAATIVLNVSAATVRQTPDLATSPNINQLDVQTDHSLFSASTIAGLDTNHDPNSAPPPVSPQSIEPLVITTKAMSAKTMNTIDEDMRIMGRLLADSAGPTKSAPWASGIPLVNYAKGAKNRNLYIEGTGALFFINVDFPLSGRTAEENTTEEAPKDTAWERARRKVYGGAANRAAGEDSIFYQYALSNYRRPKAYKPEQVRIFTEKIASSLSSATNFRALTPSDTVWVVVTGPAVLYRNENSAQLTATGLPIQFPFQQIDPTQPNTQYYAVNRNLAKETRLTISASKRDIDDLNAGVITMKEFLERMKQNTR